MKPTKLRDAAAAVILVAWAVLAAGAFAVIVVAGKLEPKKEPENSMTYKCDCR